MRGWPKPLSDYVGASNVFCLRLSPLCRCDNLGHFTYYCLICKVTNNFWGSNHLCWRTQWKEFVIYHIMYCVVSMKHWMSGKFLPSPPFLLGAFRRAFPISGFISSVLVWHRMSESWRLHQSLTFSSMLWFDFLCHIFMRLCRFRFRIWGTGRYRRLPDSRGHIRGRLAWRKWLMNIVRRGHGVCPSHILPWASRQVLPQGILFETVCLVS